MKRSYKYRLELTKSQTEVMQHTFNFCRFLYNSSLQERRSFYEKFGKGISYNTQAAELREVKREFKDQVKPIYSQCIQHVLRRLDLAYESFFKRCEKGKTPGFPRFKKYDRFRSICFPQSNLHGFGVKLLDNNKLKIYGLPGEVKVKWHRPWKGRCKQVQIVKKADKFYLVLSCDDVPKNILPSTGKTIGIDLGINSFATLDDGTSFHHPKPYKTAKEQLANYQRKLALKQKGSKNREKTKVALAKAHERIHNIREDFQHKLANKLIRENDMIIIEKLNIQDMLKSNSNSEVKNENITDASWGSFCHKFDL